jgi:hypothetical protein
MGLWTSHARYAERTKQESLGRLSHCSRNPNFETGTTHDAAVFPEKEVSDVQDWFLREAVGVVASIRWAS